MLCCLTMSYIVLLAAIYCQRNTIFLKNLISVSDPQLSEDLTNVAYFKRRRREGIHCSSGIVEFISYLDSTILIKYTKAQKNYRWTEWCRSRGSNTTKSNIIGPFPFEGNPGLNFQELTVTSGTKFSEISGKEENLAWSTAVFVNFILDPLLENTDFLDTFPENSSIICPCFESVKILGSMESAHRINYYSYLFSLSFNRVVTLKIRIIKICSS